MTAEKDRLNELRKLLRGRALLLTHHNADPDSICAAHALKELITRLDASSEAGIYMPGGASSLSKRIITGLDIEILDDASIEDYSVVVVLDTATLMQLDDWGDRVADSEVTKVFIDHHSPNTETESTATIYFVDQGAHSTCEVVQWLYEGYGLAPSSNAARALLVGMAYDSKHFSLGSSRSFQSASRLLEVGGPLEEVLALLIAERDRSDNIARLKSAQRMQLHMVGEWVITTSSLNSYQASAARGLLGLGADVAVVAGNVGKELRASLRSTDRFHMETSIHLGSDVARVLGEEFGGAGSGHPTAAGVNGEGGPMDLLKRAVGIIVDKLE
ncbi:MAG: DHH family phosphoesterase [Candidatus Bathyarchaeota archaeon]|nr:MAG: DHH family phosphoesterase [Candidatus Bathyarchaeota archaeon]